MSDKPLRLTPGVIQEYSCYCSRKTKVLKRWTDADVLIQRNHAESETGFRVIDKDSNSVERLFDIPQGKSDDLIVEFIDNDPHEPEKFLGITVTCKSPNSVTTFRMKDIVQQRWLMASLGATGRGLFSPVLGTKERELEQKWTGIWDITHAVDPLQTAEDINKALSQETAQFPEKELPPYREREMSLYMKVPSYQTAEEKLSIAPLRILQEGIAVANREQHDTFLPPIGPAVYVLISIGLGLEVGLEAGLQELWDPVTKSRIFIDHNKQHTFYQDPRPLKQAPVLRDCRQIIYGPDRLAGIPRGDENSSTVAYHLDKAVSKRAKWGACIVAKGIDGISGASGQVGRAGTNGNAGNRGGSGFSGGRGHPGGSGGPGFKGSRVQMVRLGHVEQTAQIFRYISQGIPRI